MKKIVLFLLLFPFVPFSCTDKGPDEVIELTSLAGTYWEDTRTNGYITNSKSLTFGEEYVIIREIERDLYEILWSESEEASYDFYYPYVDIYSKYGILELTIEINKFMVSEPNSYGYIEEYVRKR